MPTNVVSVAVPSPAYYGSGAYLDFDVTFDDVVTVNTAGGTPRIALTVGSSTVYATYLSGSGTFTLKFRYTVHAGDLDADGISVGALQQNGGTLTDSSAAAVNTTLNSVGSTTSVLVDAVAPAAPTGIALTLASDSGTVGDHITTVSRPTFTGQAEAGANVAVLIDGTTVGSVTANGAGAWSYQPTTALAVGNHTIQAMAIDAAGNQSPVSTGFVMAIAAPPTVASITRVSASPTGISSFSFDVTFSEAVVNVNSTDFVITGGATGNISVSTSDNLTYRVTIGGGNLATFNGTVGLGFAVGQNIAASADSSNLLVSTTPTGSNQTYTLDHIAPAAPSVTLAPASDSGVLGDGRTNDATPTLTGTTEANATVTIKDGTTTLGTAVANASGVWQFTTAALTDGAHAITAFATDLANNAGPPSSAFTLVIDTAAPGQPTLVVKDSGAHTLASGDHTGAASLLLSGVAEANAIVTIKDGTTVLGTVTASSGGAWSYTTASLALGAHTLTASATDAAGNAGAASTGFAVTIDAPSPPIDWSTVPTRGSTIVLNGTPHANSTLIGSFGNDTFRGTDSGIDTAVQNGTRFINTTITVAADGTVTMTGGNGTDTLIEIDRIHFDDGVLLLNPAPQAAEALRLYGAAFGRLPDEVGLNTQLQSMASGMTPLRLAEALLQSPEFTSRNGAALNDADFVTALYQNALHRTPDTPGLNVQLDALAHGVSRAQLLLNFANSAEEVQKTGLYTSKGVFVAYPDPLLG